MTFLQQILGRGRCVHSILAAMLIGTPAVATDFTSPTLGSRLEDPADLRVENVRILAENLLNDGRMLLEVAADLRNLDVGTWSGVLLGTTLEMVQEGTVSVLGSVLSAARIATGEALEMPGLVHVVVDAADLVTARQELLDGTVLRKTAKSLAGTVLESEVVIESVLIVQEIQLSDGRILLSAAVTVRNELQEDIVDIVVELSGILGSITYSVVDAALEFPSIPPGGLVTAPDSTGFRVAVPVADLERVRADFESGAALGVSGLELFVFTAPPRGIDAATEDVWLPPARSAGNNEVELVFGGPTTYLTSLQPGDLLVEDPGVNSLSAPEYDNPFNPNDDNPDKVLADHLPFEVLSVTTGANGERVVRGVTRPLLEVVKSATFFQDSRTAAYDSPVRDPYDPDIENTYTDEEQEERATLAALIADTDPRDGRLADLNGMTAAPWTFNDLQISPRVRLSGEVLLRSSGLRIEVKIRDFVLQRAVAHIDAGVVMNLVVECDGSVETSLLPEAEKSVDLFDQLLPGVTFNIAGVPVQVAPQFFARAGVEANVPQELTLPLQASFTVGMDMGWDRARITDEDDGFFYEPTTEFIPIRVSDPTVFDDAEATVGIWAEIGAGMVGSVAPIGLGSRGILNMGPSLSVKAGADFTLAPLDNPWWSVDVDVDVTGNFAMNILGETLVDAEIPVLSFEMPELDRDAGGPLAASGEGAAGGTSRAGFRTALPATDTCDCNAQFAGFEALAGSRVRWSRAFQPSDRVTELRQAFVFHLPAPDDGDVIAGGADAGGSFVARFDPEGNLVWMRNMGTYSTVMFGAPLDGGEFIVVGKQASDLTVSGFDALGNRLWSRRHSPANLLTNPTDIGVLRQADGTAAAVFVAGIVDNAVVTESDVWLAKFDVTGDLVWSQVYPHPGDDEVHGLFIPDYSQKLDLVAPGAPEPGGETTGELFLAGFTAADVADPEIGIPDADNTLKNASSNGLLMKVDAGTGAVIWSETYVARRGLSFSDVVQAPDGDLYVGGEAARIVTETRPVHFLARLDGNGVLKHSAMIGDDPDLPDLLSTGGNTPYDTLARILWTDDGPVAVGSTGLGEDRAAWLMGLTAELGVRFHSVFDGSQADALMDVTVGPDGMTAMGSTRSVYPWGTGGRQIPWLVRLPWEGLMRFHEDLGVRSLVLPPRVYRGDVDADFQILSSTGGGGSPTQTFTRLQSPVVMSVADLALTPNGTAAEPLDTTNPLVLAVEKIERGLIEDYSDWVVYHQLSGDDADPRADTDGDGLENALEAFFGRNPRVPESDPPVSIQTGDLQGQQVVVIEFNRTSGSQSFGVRFESSETMEQWLEATGFDEVAEPIDASRERVRLVTVQDVPVRFFRIVADAAGVQPAASR